MSADTSQTYCMYYSSDDSYTDISSARQRPSLFRKNMSEKTTTEQGQGRGSHYIYEDKQFTPCLHFCLHLNSKGGQMAFDFLWLSRNMHHCSPDTSIQIHSYLDAFLVWMALPWPPVTLWRINYFWPRMFSLTRKLRKPSFLCRVNRRHPFSEWCWNTCSYISF